MAQIEQKGLAQERWNRLREMLRQRGAVRLNELCNELNVSAATVRRDLEQLEKLGELRRVHGGAVSVGNRLEEPLFDEKALIGTEEKQRIAQEAVKQIQSGDTIYLDGGSTVLEMAHLLKDHGSVTVVTNSLRVALELSGGGPRLVLIGGELRRLSQTLVGALTRHMLEKLFVDKAFMGTLGMSLNEGPTTTDPAEAYTKEFVMGRAHKVFMLVDSTKIGKVGLSRAGKLEDVDVLITDAGIDPQFVKGISRMGIEVIQA